MNTNDIFNMLTPVYSVLVIQSYIISSSNSVHNRHGETSKKQKKKKNIVLNIYILKLKCVICN